MISAPEQTIEEWCGASGHELSYHFDSETGWPICYCEMFTEPPGGEPHDEYSATCANLIEAYIAILGDAITGNPSYINIRYADMRIAVHRALDGESPQYLLSLLESVQNSVLQHLESCLNVSKASLDLFVTLGTHLDFYGMDAVNAVLHGFAWSDNDPETRKTSGIKLITPDNIGLARTAATLHKLIAEPLTRRTSATNLERNFVAVCPHLEHRQEMIKSAAAIYNTKGINSDATEMIIDLINSGEGQIQATLAVGLL